jgi:hypothetical protein
MGKGNIAKFSERKISAIHMKAMAHLARLLAPAAELAGMRSTQSCV